MNIHGATVGSWCRSGLMVQQFGLHGFMRWFFYFILFYFFFLAYLFIVNCRVHVHGVQIDSRVSIFLPSLKFFLFFNYNQYMWYYFGFSFGVESAEYFTEIGFPFG